MALHHHTWCRHSHVSPTCHTNTRSGPPPLNSTTFHLASVNGRRSCISCCRSKYAEQSANRRYISLVTVGVQKQAEPILMLIIGIFLFLFLSLNSSPCSSFNCLGHFKNVYDDNDNNDDISLATSIYYAQISFL